ncbi:MAG: GIY-YIG nuclease family protein [Oenococcus sp.]|uniref:GIY-YIG nuclease family protein n=2 Tax=Oenococcus sp. TaxID=1979414 RepID=UPI0039E9B135
MKPFTINTFFPNGDASGFRISEIPTMQIQASYIPRNLMKKVIQERKELQWNGVYTLFDLRNDEAVRRTVYIGESENVGGRLNQHNNKQEDWWGIAVVFVINSETHQLSKADIKYLENLMYTRAVEAGTMDIYNGNTPHQSFVNEARKFDLQDFFINIDLLLRSYGFSVFSNPIQPPIPETESDSVTDELVYFSGRGGEATAKYTNEGLVVQKGSKISPLEPSATFPNLSLLNKLIKNGIIKDGLFTVDYPFSSPSGAGNIIYKANCNGWTKWHDKSGKTLEELYR